MRLKLRLLAAIWLPLIIVLAGFGYVSVARERVRLTTDLERRAWLLGETLKEAIEPLIEKGPRAQIARIVQRFADPGRGVAVYDRSGRLVAASPDWVPRQEALPSVAEALSAVAPQHGFRTFNSRPVYEYQPPSGGMLAKPCSVRNRSISSSGLIPASIRRYDLRISSSSKITELFDCSLPTRRDDRSSVPSPAKPSTALNSIAPPPAVCCVLPVRSRWTCCRRRPVPYT